MTNSSFVDWLHKLLGAAPYSHSQWSTIINAHPEQIRAWLTGLKLPAPEHLRSLIRTVVEDMRISDEFVEEIERFTHQRLNDLWKCEPWEMDYISPNMTLGEYLILPLKRTLFHAMSRLSPGLQEKLIYHVSDEIRRYAQFDETGVSSIFSRKGLWPNGVWHAGDGH